MWRAEKLAWLSYSVIPTGTSQTARDASMLFSFLINVSANNIFIWSYAFFSAMPSILSLRVPAKLCRGAQFKPFKPTNKNILTPSIGENEN
jgi:hypothetical protein